MRNPYPYPPVTFGDSPLEKGAFKLPPLKASPRGEAVAASAVTDEVFKEILSTR